MSGGDGEDLVSIDIIIMPTTGAYGVLPELRQLLA